MSRWQRGFTVIELIIVMAISGLLLLGVVSSWSNQRRTFAFHGEIDRIVGEMKKVQNEANQSISNPEALHTGQTNIEIVGKTMGFTQHHATFYPFAGRGGCYNRCYVGHDSMLVSTLISLPPCPSGMPAQTTCGQDSCSLVPGANPPQCPIIGKATYDAAVSLGIPKPPLFFFRERVIFAGVNNSPNGNVETNAGVAFTRNPTRIWTHFYNGAGEIAEDGSVVRSGVLTDNADTSNRLPIELIFKDIDGRQAIIRIDPTTNTITRKFD